MRIDCVSAGAFGPFVGETLTLGPGLNVVWGPNEAGKSSWHAALYFGLCGRRRGNGPASRDERELRSRHEPWEGGQWQAGVVVTLEDDRRIELRHDLRGQVDCQARDLGLGGRDVSGEIIVGNDTPDGARWLGLDRRTFLTVACVRQGDLLAVRQNSKLLQDHLQRGAATGGADETAVAALERVDQCRREQVGANHRAAVGPLRRATVAVERARTALETARSEHRAYCRLLSRLHELEDAEASARDALDRAEAAWAKVEASSPTQALQERAEAARRHVDAASTRRSSPRLLLVALAVAIAGVTIAAFVQVLIGIALVLIACGLVIFGIARRDQLAIGEAVEALRAAHEAHTSALRAYESAARATVEARAQLAERTRGLQSVAEAEENLVDAEAELARIQALDRTLDLTRGFLLDAQERVHRSVAPRLGEQLARWLPRVTSGRYIDALVDPSSLAVAVRASGGPWREASLLSHGTAEQIYVLLRVALADHLTRPSERCPLILDEPTAHFDAERTEAVLDLLLELAAERQVIVFSQELAVLAWAEHHLEAPTHRLVRLPGRIPTG